MRPYQTETLQPWQREIVERTVEVESGRFAARRLALMTPRHKPFMPAAEMAATAGDEPSPRQAWQSVIGLALLMIVAAFVLGYVVGRLG